jgi:ATP-dependent RNA helicase DDX19/DBP5
MLLLLLTFMFRRLPRGIQVLLFSATFPDKVMAYADKFAPNALKMTLAQSEQTVKGIAQMYMDCPTEKEKYDVLCKLYGLMTIGSSVIFVKVSPRPSTRG